jgi:hypothetical protein
MMSQPGPAQLELIRRYSRTLRQLHADAMRARGPRIGAREQRRQSGAGDGISPVTGAADAIAPAPRRIATP